MDAGAVATIAGVVSVAANHVMEALPMAVRHVRAMWSAGRAAASLRDALLVGGRGAMGYRHDAVHPLFSGTRTLHPDNLAALTATCGKEMAEANVEGRLRELDDVTMSTSNDLFLIGSAISEGISRPVFGYTADDDTADSLTLSNPPVDLPFHIVCSRAEIHPRALARRWVRGIPEPVARPNWRIKGPDSSFVPQVDSEGFLCDDYLLITKVRNYLWPDALDSGRSIVSVGGAHGTATRSVELLLRDRALLARISDFVNAHPNAFQIVFRAGSLAHNARTGTRARTIELACDPIGLPDSEAVWREAVSVANQNFLAWRGAGQ